MEDDDLSLEKFYVYRSLHSDESWGATLAGSAIATLPNIDFGILVFAVNEKHAITRARDLYERIHKWDSDKSNVREFAKEALNSLIDAKPKGTDTAALAKEAIKIAVEMNNEFNKHFDALGGTDIRAAKDAAADERRSRERKVNLRQSSNGESSERRLTGS